MPDLGPENRKIGGRVGLCGASGRAPRAAGGRERRSPEQPQPQPSTFRPARPARVRPQASPARRVATPYPPIKGECTRLDRYTACIRP
ncbi:hypothetical protein Pa4123_23340 [Phytohabitans aurantiacus]|uniref:Uncharacterized protein n=1 Tax=Phytohabitans aurantiacus TaxID=3016789 RepID=A0ABQ5QR19_9ACTN|nr:hypothetical protein Pa4123_23340 [Phytohabitans aurantiacus]